MMAAEYRTIKKLGEGATGVVYKALEVSTNSVCALKKIPLDQDDGGVPLEAAREISFLKELHHENIVKLLDVAHSDDCIWLVLEYLHMDLKKYIESHPELSTKPTSIKDFLRQLLLGVSYCHSHRIINRDLKPNNLLMDSQTDTLKLADFGHAREFGALHTKYTREVVPLWYRAPELLLGSKDYSAAVDIWSVGCIFAHMLRGRPLFEGDNEVQTLGKIFCLMGTPTDEPWPGVCRLPRHNEAMPEWNPQDLQVVFPGLDPVGIDLLSRMLRMNPAERITAKDALAHPFFNNAGVAETPSQGPPP